VLLKPHISHEQDILSVLGTESEWGDSDQQDLPDDYDSHEAPKRLAPKKQARRKMSKAYHWVICDAAKARHKLDTAESDKQPDRTQLLEALYKNSARTLPRVTPGMISKVSALAEDYPNFEPVLRYVCRKLQLCRLLREPVYIPPLLLSGPPGVGKTQFIKTLAGILAASFSFLSMGETTAGFVLTGSSRGWSTSTVGIVARSIIEAPDGHAVMILLDELDKTMSNSNYPADRSLLGLLEPHTASHFRDESLELEFDARPVNWFLTCNDVHAVRPEIMSRVHHIAVPVPTKHQMPKIVRSIDASLRQRSPSMSRVFEPLDESVANELSALPPRIVARVLNEAYGRIAETTTSVTKRLRLSPHIVRQAQAALTSETSSSRPMGFF
jgi:ATP-dependent Lon protease